MKRLTRTWEQSGYLAELADMAQAAMRELN
jgi:hypothetical protein